jgi:hypothetical protein
MPIAKPTAVSDDLQRRLDSLRVDTGAMHLTLTTAVGEILFSAGDGRQFDLKKLMGIVADNLSHSFLLGDELGAAEPFTLQSFLIWRRAGDESVRFGCLRSVPLRICARCCLR